ncbi:hypothetical protein GKZ90_0013655 [Flavobacterium sp. MC2016-06]|uniref:hypothetical protein n=1 Tax=Flavobacterium sp. MC2016-06 TaxID=2676308 RepID=UPI0012BA8EC3|nr:hypothetical protein [Flavobacterium sp. MC2016-06]MBU3859869.1 hypothetical protein [Flavobacterium sp. MC2016-06]
MAIWQQGMIVIPAVSEILPKPNKELHFEYEDAWRKLSIDHKKFVEEIDSFIPRAHWVKSNDYFSWKGDTENKEDNDVDLCIDPKSGIIISLGFRFDLRTESPYFLEKILGLCIKNGWKIETYGGFFFQPNLTIIPEVIKQSAWREFLSNPEAYVEKIKDEPWNKKE